MKTDAPDKLTTTDSPASDALAGILQDYMQVTQRLQDTHDVLQREVVRLREELASKDRELERRRRLAALGELAAGVAHEVRNPLGAIQLCSQLLRSELAREDIDAALNLIAKIETGVSAIDGVVRDTLALAPRDGKTAQCVLTEIVQRSVDMCAGVLAQRGVSVELSLDETIAVAGHPDGLQRVIVNLISNAADASPRGAAIEVTVASETEGAALVRVSDRGVGLSDEVIDRIFDPFFTTKDHGTGLGLTIAHRLVEAHGGQLAANSRPGGGAEFTVTLPAEAPRKRARPSRRKGLSAA